QLLQRVPWLVQHTGYIQKGFGAVMVLMGLAIYFNVDRQFQTWVLQTFPNYGTGLTKIEENKAVQERLNQLDGSQSETNTEGRPLFELQESMSYPQAPDFTGGTNWINSEPLLLSDQLQGKVVLVDFWTYSCINCIRTFPYVTKWYETYKDKGFVIVGVHAPEFEFEKNADNVMAAMEEYGITYPVVQDNDFQIWRAYNNRYWPAHYLIDKTGKIRYTHFGEGKYSETENKIRELLGEEQIVISEEEVRPNNRSQSPEIYLGYKRAANYVRPGSGEIVLDETARYTLPTEALPLHAVGLEGSWKVEAERIVAGETGAKLHLHFTAGKVHLVLTPPDQGNGRVRVLLNGQPLESGTEDVDDQGSLLVTSARKYDVASFDETADATLTLEFSEGTSAYAFTFGQ
ncbi:thioredoxin family protein, partial [Candidatus Woesebacteria bacterium]|nr:thioredoxin family protein [Candidatus Woesebacteria bacterium]